MMDQGQQNATIPLELPSLDGADLYCSANFKNGDEIEAESCVVDGKVPKKDGAKPRQEVSIFDRDTLDDLHKCLETFKGQRKTLNHCYTETIEHFVDLRTKLSITDDMGTKILFMSEDDKNSVEQILKKNPVILVVGQTNCGKTSLINEILQSSYLPTSEYPCTARLVRTKFSKEGYIKITDEKGNEVGDAIPGKLKRVPREYIVLEGEARESKDTVQQVVEVGIDDPLLSCGVEIVDAPGMCENEALNNIVQECLDGVLQVLLYVIDGNTSLRRPDVSFLYSLKRMAPNMRIIYVCNKVEEDKVAEEYDRPSDAESSSEEDDFDDARTSNVRDKGQLAFLRLQKCGLIDDEEKMETCSYFHPVSCLQVRNVRRKRKKDERAQKFLLSFQKLLGCLIKHFEECVSRHLRFTTARLLTVQRRTFDFFIADKFLNVPRIEQLPTVIQKIMKEERDHYTEMLQHLHQQEVQMTGIINSYLHGSEDRIKIIKDAGDMTFAPIKIGNEIQRNHLINECRRQVRDFVLMRVTKDIENIVRHVKEAIRQTFQDNFQSTVMKFSDIGPISDILMEQLDSNYLTLRSGSPVLIDADIVKEGFGVKAMMTVENIQANMKGIYLDMNWRRDTAKGVLRSVDATKLAASICGRFHNQLKRGHENFTMAMQQINCLYSVRQRQTQSVQKELLKQVPFFASIICRTEALHTTVEYGPVDLHGELGNGNRAIIYDCTRSKLSTENRPKKLVVAKVFRSSDIPQDFATIYNYLRLLPHADHFLKPLGVAFTKDDHFAALLPRVDTDLFTELTSKSPLRERFSIRQRLELALDIASACNHAAKNGFRLTDLRPNNIMLMLRDKSPPLVKIHVVKWKVEEVPYPDGKPSFHFAPEAYHAHKNRRGTLSRTLSKVHDSYSMAVITWLLVLGEFIRPSFADTNMDDADSVKRFVIERTDEVAEAFMITLKQKAEPSLLSDEKCINLMEHILRKFITKADHRYDIQHLYDELHHHLEKMQTVENEIESYV